MYLDLHSHSVSSDDSRATVEQYLKWIQVLRKRDYTVDGIVLTEHRKFDFDKDYSELAEQYNVLVLKGSELDTRYGHFLVYGVTENLTREMDFSDVRMDSRELVKAAAHHHAIAVPAHPGRFGIGLTEYIAQGETFDDVKNRRTPERRQPHRRKRAGLGALRPLGIPRHWRKRRPPQQPYRRLPHEVHG